MMNSEHQHKTQSMMNPTRCWMACSQSAPRQQANQASFHGQGQEQLLTRFPLSRKETIHPESAFYFVNEEK